MLLPKPAEQARQRNHDCNVSERKVPERKPLPVAPLVPVDFVFDRVNDVLHDISCVNGLIAVKKGSGAGTEVPTPQI